MNEKKYGWLDDVLCMVLRKSSVHVFGYTKFDPKCAWADPKLLLGFLMWASMCWSWISGPYRAEYTSKAVYVLGLNLIILTLLQYYDSAGLFIALVFIACNLVVKTKILWVPTDLKAAGKYGADSMYEDLSLPMIQLWFLFCGQLIYAGFYFYALFFHLHNHDDFEYLHWVSGYVCVQMTAIFNRQNNYLGPDWNTAEFIDLIRIAPRTSFSEYREGGEGGQPFRVARPQLVVRFLMGFIVNSGVREMTAFTIPVLLGTFYDPLNCVVYSLAIAFITTLDDIKETKIFTLIDAGDSGLGGLEMCSRSLLDDADSSDGAPSTEPATP